MCLGIPAKIIAINEPPNELLTAEVDLGGIHKTICLSLTPEAQLGDYVLLHVGFAIKIIDRNLADELAVLVNNE